MGGSSGEESCVTAMAARECSRCKLNWPAEGFIKPSYMMGGPKYNCPVCAKPTVLRSAAVPLDAQHAEFHRFYAQDWPARREAFHADEIAAHAAEIHSLPEAA